MTLDKRGRTSRHWILAGVVALLLAALSVWLFFPLSLEEYCGRAGIAPETCFEVRTSAAGLPTSFAHWMRTLGAAIAMPIIVVVVVSFVRKQRALRTGGWPRADAGAPNA